MTDPLTHPGQLCASGDRFEWWPQEKVTHPTAWLVEVLRDYWWAVNNQGEVLIFRTRRSIHPQCNPNRLITERLGSRQAGYAGVVQIPLAFIARDPREYSDA